MGGVKQPRRRRWPGTRSQAEWLAVRRAYGGEKPAREALLRSVTAGWECDLMAGLKLLQARPDGEEGER